MHSFSQKGVVQECNENGYLCFNRVQLEIEIPITGCLLISHYTDIADRSIYQFAIQTCYENNELELVYMQVAKKVARSRLRISRFCLG